MSRPLGVYIHIPFCERRCPYCDFATSVADRAMQAEYLRALAGEIEWAGREWADAGFHVETVYLGGGTPTVLAPEQLGEILARARDHFALADGAEISIEANPGTVRRRGLSALRAAGYNRVSFGVQSLDDALLQVLGRIHTANDARASVQDARTAGFDNISADLMFGIPGQTLKQWRESLREVADSSLPHVSAYGLTYEPGTPFHQALAEERLRPVGEELELAMFWLAEEVLEDSGLRRYEISNFSRPGWECRHNGIYWGRREYLGLGSAAHSFIQGQRFWNVRDAAEYVQRLRRGRSPRAGSEVVSEEAEFREALMLGLRLWSGFDLRRLAVPEALSAAFDAALDPMVSEGFIEIADGRIRLTPKGLPLANEVIARLV